MAVPSFHVTARAKPRWAHHSQCQDMNSDIGFLCQVILLILGIPNPGYMIVFSGYLSFVAEGNVCEEEE